jgi:deoxyribonuclease V
MIEMKNKLVSAERRHAWKVTPKRAREIQGELRRFWEGPDRLPEIRTVAGLDAAFVLTGRQALRNSQNRSERMRAANRAIGCVVLYEFPAMVEIGRAHAVLPLRFPYVPGLLSFREIPVLLAALAKLRTLPDLLFCDGQGIAHPRRMGLATHLGILLDRPTIGCAKSLLVGTHARPGNRAGSWVPLVDNRAGGERIGAAVRTRAGAQPVFVSQGNRVALETAVKLTLRVSDGYRIPRPTREADRCAGETKRKVLGQAGEISGAQASEK